MLCYDLSKPESLYDLVPVVTEISKSKLTEKLPDDQRKKHNLPFVPCVIVGNKADLVQDEESKTKLFAEATQFARKNLHMEFATQLTTASKQPLVFFVSSLDQDSLNHVFSSLCIQFDEYQGIFQESIEASFAAAFLGKK